MVRRTKRHKAPYKSGLEMDLHMGDLTHCQYEPIQVPYTVVGMYTPDFVPEDQPDVWLEAKGRFRDYAEAKKYLAIQKIYPEKRLIFIFQNPNRKAYAQCKKRKDGTYMSLAEWAELNGFEWYSLTNIPEVF